MDKGHMKLNEMLAYKVAMLSSDLSESLYKVYAPYQLTMPQWRILATLGEVAEIMPNELIATEFIPPEPSSIESDEQEITEAKNNLPRGALTAKHIAFATRLDKVQVSRALLTMENNNLIFRSPSEEDRRATEVFLTDEGKEVYQTLVPLVAKWQKEKLAGITETEYETFLKVIAALTTSLTT
ncbi:hypothetical protein KUL42_24970 [Alteromonas sp. KUL42]|uniref:MarR family winged helix-turn-helix transcriptional regulator n=1 Tax=Alteromonas sp. KUL42 TaxID=2480797 RepID=UPI0010FFB794|nr:MarR family transcriptional regulator [Alteromonas sp. KUL42]GEA07736.1 hypothetical protein KUL42_24970 [Alteromonas sp. KUL42]